MSVHAVVESRRSELARLCERFGVESLTLFGSAVTDEFDEQTSDLDFLVAFRTDVKQGGLADSYFGLLAALEELFERPIDLVTDGSVKNPYVLQAIQAHNECLYAA
jgi:predicted nucleotidyltransferase